MTEVYKDGVRVVGDGLASLGPLPPYEDPTTLTRRDRFAMAALTGLLANNDASGIPLAFAVMSYDIADAMETARNNEGGG